jgi:hypothetical protein
MEKHTPRLSSSELGGLWATYIQETMAVSLIQYFLHHNQDEEIKDVLTQALEVSVSHVKFITTIFTIEQIPIPDGFSEKDIDFTAPPLFYDPFGLSFVYCMSRISLINTSFITANVAREDVMEFFIEMVKEQTKLYKLSTSLLLAKGIYDRPPMVPYPREIEYIEKVSYINGIGKKRPLNTAELTEIFFNTERNYFSILLCTGLLQVVKDKEIHDYIKDGKKISEKQIQTFNDILKREELLGNVPMTMEVTDSQTLPFSERLIVMLFHSLNSIDITLLGHALSLSMRSDLALYYQKYLLEVLAYSVRGFDIIVQRGWMQSPPHAPDRRSLQKLI